MGIEAFLAMNEHGSRILGGMGVAGHADISVED